MACLGAAPVLRGADLPDVSPVERQRIEAAIPTQALVKPTRPRKLLIFDRNVNYGGHPSIRTANLAFTLMGQRTKAFETEIHTDPEVFRRESLRRFDAVFFNNNVGNLFQDPELRRNVEEFVYGGGGLMGVHGTTVAFTQWPGALEDWPEFGLMIGARGANHKASDERVVIHVDDPGHPLTRVFRGNSFEYRDEFFRVHEPYSRDRLRVLLTIDTNRTDMNQKPAYGKLVRSDNDYALAWVRNYGRGRTFYCTIAHNPSVFWDPKMLEFYLGAVQFILGDLPAPTVPSAKVTEAMRAQEKLGWRLGIEAYTFHKFTLFEAIEKTAQLGLPFMGGLSFQKVSRDIPKDFDPELSDEVLARVRAKLEAAGVRLLTYYVQQLPADPSQCRKYFEFARKIGIEAFMSEPMPEAFDTIERLCDEYDIRVGLHNHDQKASPRYWRPQGILEACQGRSARIGACVDLGYWLRSGIDPLEGLKLLGDRLVTIQAHDLNETGKEGHDVPWGTGVSALAGVFETMQRLGQKPVMVGLEYSYNWLESMPDLARSIQFFNDTTVKLAREEKP